MARAAQNTKAAEEAAKADTEAVKEAEEAAASEHAAKEAVKAEAEVVKDQKRRWIFTHGISNVALGTCAGGAANHTLVPSVGREPLLDLSLRTLRLTSGRSPLSGRPCRRARFRSGCCSERVLQLRRAIVRCYMSFSLRASWPSASATTLLMLAAHAGRLGAVQLLLRMSEHLGHNVELRDGRDATALAHASRRGHADVVSELLQTGLATQNKRTKTADGRH